MLGSMHLASVGEGEDGEKEPWDGLDDGDGVREGQGGGARVGQGRAREVSGESRERRGAGRRSSRLSSRRNIATRTTHFVTGLPDSSCVGYGSHLPRDGAIRVSPEE